MDEFKPEDELKPDPSDRRPGRSRKSDEFDNEPQINVDDVDFDADESRASRSHRSRHEHNEYEGDDGLKVEAAERRPARGRKKASKQKVPVSRQHLMMGIGILVLLLLIIGIGSALKAPSSDTDTVNKNPNAEKNIDLSGANDSAANQANGAQPQPGDATIANQTANTSNAQQNVSLPPVSSTPTDAPTQPASPQGQQRVEVQGDLNNALTQQQGQIDGAANGSTLPTQPATVAQISGSNNAPRQPVSASTHEPQTAPRPERKQVVIEPYKSQPTQTKVQSAQSKPQVTAKMPVAEPKSTTTAKHSEPVTAPTATAPVKAPAAMTTPAPKAAAPAATASTPASGTTVSGDASAIKGAPGSHYTLQLSSSSNSANLNAWAKKENLQHYMVYQTVRNGQPWYVLVSGVYASKDDAKRAVSTLPADVQAKNPWAKPIHQVQSDLK